MSYQNLKAEAVKLPDQERRELIGVLLSVGKERSSAYWDGIEKKIEDKDPTHWVRERDLEAALRLNEESK